MTSEQKYEQVVRWATIYKAMMVSAESHHGAQVSAIITCWEAVMNITREDVCG